VIRDIEAWWRNNQKAGRSSLLFAYALGKAQSILASLDASIGPILTHGAVSTVNQIYREEGVELPETQPADLVSAKSTLGKALVIAPPSAWGSVWVRKFQPFESAFASGWMQLRGARRRRALDRGFPLSDHADWPDLLQTVKETEARYVGVMHGQTGPLARYLREKGLTTWELKTHYEMEEE
jgi:putative mRNA 3-end processing factor